MMLMAREKPRERNVKRGTADMTEFGKTLNMLMVQHEVYEWKDLLELLKTKAGYKIGQPRLSGYLYGDRNPRNPQRLFDALATALDLDKEGKTRSIYSYGFPEGGAHKINDEHIERSRVAEEEIRRQARGYSSEEEHGDGPAGSRG
jgi:hypothetical protein